MAYSWLIFVHFYVSICKWLPFLPYFAHTHTTSLRIVIWFSEVVASRTCAILFLDFPRACCGRHWLMYDCVQETGLSQLEFSLIIHKLLCLCAIPSSLICKIHIRASSKLKKFMQKNFNLRFFVTKDFSFIFVLSLVVVGSRLFFLWIKDFLSHSDLFVFAESTLLRNRFFPPIFMRQVVRCRSCLRNSFCNVNETNIFGFRWCERADSMLKTVLWSKIRLKPEWRLFFDACDLPDCQVFEMIELWLIIGWLDWRFHGFTIYSVFTFGGWLGMLAPLGSYGFVSRSLRHFYFYF